MSVATRIRHSVIGRLIRFAGHVAFTARHGRSASVEYSLTAGVRVRMRPRGDVAEFLFYAPFFEREHSASSRRC